MTGWLVLLQQYTRLQHKNEQILYSKTLLTAGYPTAEFMSKHNLPLSAGSLTVEFPYPWLCNCAPIPQVQGCGSCTLNLWWLQLFHTQVPALAVLFLAEDGVVIL